MKLAISNILWREADDEAALALAYAHGARGIEVAPTRIAPWDNLTEQAAQVYRRRLADKGLHIPSLQAILFGCQDMELLGSQPAFEALLAHLGRVGLIAQQLGAQRLVFGAPKFRKKGTLTDTAAFALATERFRLIAERMQECGTVLVLEAVTADFGGDFITATTEAAALVRAVDHAGFRLHLDMGTLVTAGEDPLTLIQAHADILAHVHLSRPGLGPITAMPEIDAALDTALSQQNYQGWISLEILPQDNPLPIVAASLDLAQQILPKTLGAP